MQLPFIYLRKTAKLEYAIIFSVILLVFKMIYPGGESLLVLLFSEILVLASVYLWFLYIIEIINLRKTNPLGLVLNTGILAAILFFVFAISSEVVSKSEGEVSGNNFLANLFTILISYAFIGALLYIIGVFRDLFFLRQKTDPKTYFNTLLLFFTLAYFSNYLVRIDQNFDYLRNSFYVVSIVLISINSLRVAWIAFLQKKQKVYLLIISIVLTVLFGINFSLTLEDGVIRALMENFSPGMHTVFNLTMLYGTIYFGVIFFTSLFHLPTAEAFDRKAEEVSSLMDLSKLITQVFDFKELADTVTTITSNVCNSDAAWLVTQEEDRIELRSVNNIGYVEADNLTTALLLEYSYDISEVLILNHRPFKVKINNDIRTFNYSSMAIAPLKVHDDVSGYLFVVRKKDFVFDDDDRKAIEAFADYAAVALENAKLLEESIEKERLEKELDVAREIQYKILPHDTPKLDNVKISALFIPAFEVGGDYYDFFKVDDNKLGFVIADVSGKGISAAFIMAEVKGIFETLSRLVISPKELLIKANEILWESMERKNFVTAVYGILDTQKGVITFSRAGHTPTMFINGDKVEQLAPQGIGLGLDHGLNFRNNIEELEIKLSNDDTLTFYTDGITESQNADMEEFGYDRFKKLLLKNAEFDPDIIANEIMKELTIFSKDKCQHDDITLVILKWCFNK